MNASPSSETGSREAREALKRAEQVTLADFSASLSAGILTAIEARRLGGGSSGGRWLPQIWAGWWIGEPPWWAGGRDGDIPGGGGGFPGGGLGGGG